MQSKKFVDGTVSPKLNFRALAEKVIEKNKSVIKKLGKKKNKVKPVTAVAMVKGGKLKSFVVSNKDNTGEKRKDWIGLLNNVVSTAGATVTGVFASKHAAASQPQIQQVPAPAAQAAPSGNEDNKAKDNTMLYAGIGGAVLLVVILVVMLKK